MTSDRQARISPLKRFLVAALCLWLIEGRASPQAETLARDWPEASAPKAFDYAGLVHLHTDYSDDATGSYEDLAQAAAAQDITFLIVTDHNTLQPVADGRQGWRNGVLMLSGIESSRPEGHLLGLDVTTAPTDRETPTTDFLASVRSQSGQAFIAHPRHRKWAWQGPIDRRISGMEILDLADQFYDAPAQAKAAAIAALPFRPMAAYLELGGRPTAALDLWDQTTQARRFVGLYAPDIHQAIELGDRKIRFPPAADIMRIARNHIVMEAPFSGDWKADAASLYGALKAGRLFVSLDVLADGKGFMFWADQPDGPAAWMGDEIEAGSTATYKVRLPASAAPLNPVIHILKNGLEIARSQAGDPSLDYETRDPGVYRVEVSTRVPSLMGLRRDVTWIYSNPIYARPQSTG